MTENTVNYKFLDSGEGRRLEQFGSLLLDRPAPQATYPKGLSQEIWQRAEASFLRDKGKENPRWILRGNQDPQNINFSYCQESIELALHLSENGQVGVYPEQLDNWLWISQRVKEAQRPLRILNGFAYTGGSTLFSALNNEEGQVYHLDASKSAINRAKINQKCSHLEKRDIRFIVEDMMTFLERELKRGNTFDGIILDPPAFGRAPGKKTWRIKKDLPKLMGLCAKLLSDTPSFILLSCHEADISIEELQNYLLSFRGIKKEHIERLTLKIPPQGEGNPLENGKAVRFAF